MAFDAGATGSYIASGLGADADDSDVLAGFARAFPDVLWVKTADAQRLLWVSQTVESIAGYPAADLVSGRRQWEDFVHPDDHSRVLAAMRRAPEGQFDEEYRIVTRGGATRWMRDRAFPLLDDAGRVSRVIGVCTDITAHKERARSMRAVQHRFQAMVEWSDDVFMVLDSHGVVLYVSGSHERNFGLGAADVVGRPLAARIHAHDLDHARRLAAELMNLPGSRSSGRLRLRRGDGSYAIVEGTASNLLHNPDIGAILLNYRDVTARHEAELALQRANAELQCLNAELESRVAARTAELERRGNELSVLAARNAALVAALPDLILRYGIDGTLREISGNHQHLIAPAEQLVGRGIFELGLPPDVARVQLDCFNRAHETRTTEVCNYSLMIRGELLDFEARVFRSADQEVVAVVRDVTDRRRAERRISYLARFDALTGLANRASLRVELAAMIDTARREQAGVCALFLDLDGFKRINDSLGHIAGDELLRTVANRLKRALPADKAGGALARAGVAGPASVLDPLGGAPIFDPAATRHLAARFGGDEFVAIAYLPRGVMLDSHARMLGHAIMTAISPPMTIARQRVGVTPSIGIALFPAHARGADELLQRADGAMYAAKAAGKACVCMAGEAAPPAGTPGAGG
ncbi:sensor domain-containing protein [Derxia gummosa]|uniref:Sensor domain-containing protein n=1 Tax=Derxia gummosa DSM 723 TaxID=1121388 RepID=A0A8B6X4M0_9BURK|nr:GGDEF domain-containing protein [Derxia gummosa]